MKNTLIIAFLFLFILTTKAQELDKNKNYTPVVIGFWNVENFYDTLNDPLKNDEDFLPNGTYGWTGKKFRNKLNNISTVISQLGTDATPDGVAVIGLCEIENRSVLESIVAAPKLASRGYKIVHVEGPDIRGVDVAFLYNPKYFKVTSFHSYKLVLPTDSTRATRDQLLINGKLLGEDFHFIICHWPSRGGPNSEPNRIAAGKLGRKIIDSLLQADANAKVILMGDLNDDPTDQSIHKYLNTTGKKEKAKAPLLFNPMEADYRKGNGTLAYQDSWNLFDQQIMTPALAKNDYKDLQFYQSHRFYKPMVLTESGRYKGYPLRTHSGGEYLNGYSDHLAVYSVLLRENIKK